VTCSVSLEQKEVLEAWESLREQDIDVEAKLEANGKAEMILWGIKSLLATQKALKTAFGKTALKLEKKVGFNSQYAITQIGDVEVRVYADFDNGAFEGCRVVYENVQVPEKTIPAHTERKARIICNGSEGV